MIIGLSSDNSMKGKSWGAYVSILFGAVLFIPNFWGIQQTMEYSDITIGYATFLIGCFLIFLSGFLIIRDRFSGYHYYFYSNDYRKRFILLLLGTVLAVAAGLYWLFIIGNSSALPISFILSFPLVFSVFIRYKKLFSKSSDINPEKIGKLTPEPFLSSSFNQPSSKFAYQSPKNVVQTKNSSIPNYNIGVRVIAIANRASMEALGFSTGKKGESSGSILKILFYLGIIFVSLFIIVLLNS